jgi:hypothetical protein
MASISGLQNNPTNNLNTIDGLQIINATSIYDNGVLVDTTNLVPYTGATQTINAGAQNIQTTHAPVAGNDVVNLTTLQNAILYVEGISAANFVPYTGATGNTNLGTNSLTAANITATTKLTTSTAQANLINVMSAGDDYSVSINTNNLEFKNLTTNEKIYTDGGSLWLPSRLFVSDTVYTVDNQLTGKQYFRYGTSSQFSEGVNVNDNYQISDDTGASVLELSKTTGATVSKLNITSVPSATPTYALGVNGIGSVVSFPVPSATNIFPLNNTWTGTNTFNNTVVMGDTYTTNVNSAFASVQPQIANTTNLASGGTDFTGTMPVCVLTKPSTYYNLNGAGTLAMSVGLDLGYTGGSFTAGASTTITGSWTANTVNNRIAIITFDVSSHIGKSLRCVWEGVNSPYFLVSPYPYFTVVNGSTTVFSSPQPIVGTNTFAWNFTPTVGLTTITITLQASGTPSIPALAWTGFSIKQISPSRLAYKTGAKYTATFTNILASQNMTFSVYQYNTSGGSPLAISDISNMPITTSAQTITITFSVNIFPTNLGTVVFFFQPSSANQYVRFDSMTLTRADMTVSGNIQSNVVANAAIVSANPSGNSGNGSIINMSAFNGSYGSIECFDNVNATSANKLPLVLQGYGGNVGIGVVNPTQKLQVAGRGCFGYIPSSKRGIFIDNEDSYGTNPCIQGVDSVFGASAIAINPVGGYVAIGKTVPTQALDVSGDGARIQVESNTASNAVVQVKTNSNTSYMFTNQSGHLEMYPGNIDKHLLFQGVGCINGGDNYAVKNGYMQTGSLTIGDPRRNYGGSGSYWTSNTAGLMMECVDNTEIAVHDAGNNVSSFMYYLGNVFTIGRNMGWGVANTRIAGQLQARSNMTVQNGDDSFCYYGPNATWNTTMAIGAGTNKGVCQVFCTDGNLHIDARNGNAIYYGYHPNAAGNPNPHYFYGNNIQFQSGLPFQNAAYCYPVCLQGTQLFYSQCMQRRIYSNNSVAWTGGTNITYAFYKNSSNVSVKISGKFSYYVSGNIRAYPYIRTYSQSWGTYTYWSLEAFTNVGSNHTTFPFEVVLNYNDLSSPYWHDIYIYNAANCISDTNDQLWVNIQILPMSDY